MKQTIQMNNDQVVLTLKSFKESEPLNFPLPILDLVNVITAHIPRMRYLASAQKNPDGQWEIALFHVGWQALAAFPNEQAQYQRANERLLNYLSTQGLRVLPLRMNNL